MFSANFAIPNEGIEQMARKNDGASANANVREAYCDVRIHSDTNGSESQFLQMPGDDSHEVRTLIR